MAPGSAVTEATPPGAVASKPLTGSLLRSAIAAGCGDVVSTAIPLNVLLDGTLVARLLPASSSTVPERIESTASGFAL